MGALNRVFEIREDEDENDAITKSEFLSIIANKHRLHILFLLSKSEHSLSELSRELSETTIALSRHLMILRENNIISGRRHGKMVLYSLTCRRMARMIETVAELFSAKDAVEPTFIAHNSTVDRVSNEDTQVLAALFANLYPPV